MSFVKTIMGRGRMARCAALALGLLLLHGCAARTAFRTGEDRMKVEDFDRAVLQYSKALALDPGNARYTMALVRAKLGSSIRF